MFSLYFILSLSFHFITLKADPLRLDLLCQAKCLQTFRIAMSKLENNEVNKKPFLIESFCVNDQKCKGCASACSNSGDTLELCKSSCAAHKNYSAKNSCTSSCEFIDSKKMNRPGLCPSENIKTKCQFPCEKDSDCFKQGTKCCKTLLCGLSCQIAKLPTKNVPPVPMAPIVRQIIDKKEKDQINFDLEWSTYDISVVDYPVLFLVQVRIGQIVQDNGIVQGEWRDLISTTKSGVIISSIDPENWYQFRLLAFSKNGYKNHGEMTLPITVQYKPTYPMSPRNITEKLSRIIDKHVSVTMTWQPGESNSLVPVSNYNINWRRFYEMYESSPLLPEYEIVIPSTETSYTIQDLLPSTTYRIQITSVVVYKGVKYNSTGAVHYITTSAIPNSPPPQIESSFNDINTFDGCACGNSYRHLPVEIFNYTMVNGQLSMLVKMKDGIEFDNTFAPYSFKIQWFPAACIETNSWRIDSQISDLPQSIVVNNYINHYITGLRMQCTYKIEVKLFSQLAKKNIKIWDGCFCTPNCNTIAKRFPKTLSLCPQTVQYIPPVPENLRVSLHKSENESISNAKILWDCKPSNHITGFRITWGPRLEEPLDVPMYSKNLLPLLDSEKASSKVIKYPHQILFLRNLDIDKIYLVKLQSMNNHLSSQESVLFFKVHFNKSFSKLSKFHNALLFLPLSLSFMSYLL